jgi:hypothetical protein
LHELYAAFYLGWALQHRLHCVAAACCCKVDLSPLSRESLMAFAINLYNALVIHALVVHGPEQYNSSTGRIGFFQKV